MVELNLIKNVKTEYKIVIDKKASLTEQFAASELQSYIKKMTDCEIPIIKEKERCDKKVIFVGRSKTARDTANLTNLDFDNLGEDDFIVRTFQDNLFLVGGSPRATLYSVYEFLKTLGVRFIEPGIECDGEILPHMNLIKIPCIDKVESSSFSFRAIDINLTKWVNIKHEVIIISWAAKNKANWISICPIHNSDAKLIENFRKLFPEIIKRGLHILVGGHGIYYYLLLPEEYMELGKKLSSWEEFIAATNENIRNHPEWYGLARGDRRKITGTTREPDPCLSNPEVIERMCKNALTFFKYFPGVDMIRLMGNDGGASCQCERCKKMDIQRLRLDVASQIANFLSSKGVNKLVAADLMVVKGDVETRVGFARNYPKNMLYWTRLEGYDYTGTIQQDKNKPHHKLMEGANRFVEGRSHFVNKEMHGSGLYGHLYCVAPHIIAKNIKYYRDHFPGYKGTWVFINPSNLWHIFGLNLYTNFQLLWDVDTEIDKFLDDYFIHFYGSGYKEMKKIISIIEEVGPQVGQFFLSYCVLTKEKGFLLSHRDSLNFLQDMNEKLKGWKNLIQVAKKKAANSVLQERISKDEEYIKILVNWIQSMMHKVRADIYLEWAIHSKRTLGAKTVEVAPTANEKEWFDKVLELSRQEINSALAIAFRNMEGEVNWSLEGPLARKFRAMDWLRKILRRQKYLLGRKC